MFFTLDNFIRPDVINIFCDASIHKYGFMYIGCSGAIVCNNGNIIDSEYRIATNTTSNNAEIKAIRLGVNLAIKWRNIFNSNNVPVIINLFSDSQISILGIRDRIYSWRCKGNNLFGSGNSLIKNQSIFIEIINIIINSNLIINFYHQKGHVNLYKLESIDKAIHVFTASNEVRDGVDVEFIKYISTMNNKVDRTSRKYLNQKNINKYKYDAFEFSPNNHLEKLRQYNQLQGSKYYI